MNEVKVFKTFLANSGDSSWQKVTDRLMNKFLSKAMIIIKCETITIIKARGGASTEIDVYQKEYKIVFQ